MSFLSGLGDIFSGTLNAVGGVASSIGDVAGDIVGGIFAPNPVPTTGGNADVQNSNDWLAGLGQIVKEGLGIFTDVRAVLKGEDTRATTSTVPPGYYPVYNPNITASDFAFTPNIYLIGFGLALLIVVMIMKKG